MFKPIEERKMVFLKCLNYFSPLCILTLIVSLVCYKTLILIFFMSSHEYIRFSSDFPTTTLNKLVSSLLCNRNHCTLDKVSSMNSSNNFSLLLVTIWPKLYYTVVLVL